MQTQTNKLAKSSRNRMERTGSVDNSPAVQVLSMQVVPPSAFESGLPRVNIYREKRAVDVVFQALIAKANQELATLLRDIHKGPEGGLDWSTDVTSRTGNSCAQG